MGFKDSLPKLIDLYKSNQALDPGGQFQFPSPQANPLLYLTIEPRYSIYLTNDWHGSFIVGASISNVFGQPYLKAIQDSLQKPVPSTNLKFNIFGKDSGLLLASDTLTVNTTGNLIEFSLSSFKARYEPYQVTIHATSPDGKQSFSSSTQIYVLPHRNYGSAVKIDNLYGGLYVQNALNRWDGWYAVFPNGYYGDGSNLTPSNISYTNLNSYAELGFNSINIVPDGGLPEQSYPTAELEQYWDRMDELNLFNIYDMLFAFQNSTRINDQVALWKNRTTLLMWYTGDEPDGWEYPLNSTKLAYDQLKKLDPYHPVSLVLNCQDFYYEDYAAGADIIYEDAYPVAINATWSVSWNTACNTTYGDCGCDNCVGELEDVSNRLDDLQDYQANLEGQGSKPTWAVVQAFGAQEYWSRVPTAAEVESMMLLAINHNAKGLSNWIYPSTDEVNAGSGQLGKVFSTKPGMDFIFGTNAIKGLSTNAVTIDASAWIVGNQMMVGFTNVVNETSSSVVTIRLPRDIRSIENILYGDTTSRQWTIKGNTISKVGLTALEVGILVLNIRT